MKGTPWGGGVVDYWDCGREGKGKKTKGLKVWVKERTGAVSIV